MNTKTAFIQTVAGRIPVADALPILPHEHIMVDFAGADITGPHRWNREEVADTVQPYLKELAGRGWKTLVECTPKWLGRDVSLLKALSGRTGLNIITNTGLYKNQYLPEGITGLSADEIAADWISEAHDGIEGSGIRPGFIKTAVDSYPLNPIQRTLLMAAAITSRETGLTIATHTEDAAAAAEILDILESTGLDPAKWIYVHAHLEKKVSALKEIAGRGCWVELDGIGWGEDDGIREKLEYLLDSGYENQILLSQDAGWYHAGEPGGGEFRPYTVLADVFLPSLKTTAVSSDAIQKIVVENPGQAFSLN